MQDLHVLAYVSKQEAGTCRTNDASLVNVRRQLFLENEIHFIKLSRGDGRHPLRQLEWENSSLPFSNG